MKSKENSTTLRMLMPQWQGGDNPNYSFGAELLEWLAPENNKHITVKVPVSMSDDTPLEKEEGIIGDIVGKEQLLNQLDAANHIIKAYQPDRIVMFGGDCLVEQAPFAYLNERYSGELGLLWIDAHPDITTPKEYYNGHTYVLGNLLGEGAPEFAAKVDKPFRPENVMIAGIDQPTGQESELISRLSIKSASSSQLKESSKTVLDWIETNRIKYLVIHLDLDVLDPKIFRSLLFANPLSDLEIDFPMGKMQLFEVAKLINEVSDVTDVVGLGITEHLPWDAINLKQLLQKMPILND
ncbi:arginase family protein [Paenibacillus sp. FSL H7-689]|uniref:arginase family protein n=1 Tax=Paenibacillus sp. FSL H7-689 TaxID=1227349 RepID=UPI0003E2BF22|nr:arginase family protein [Paenibacillus sp. FSL H7-689]ETT43863.1 hypothetical protein C170_25877 [Paenibacillus sp. FSL H7-689]